MVFKQGHRGIRHRGEATRPICSALAHDVAIVRFDPAMSLQEVERHYESLSFTESGLPRPRRHPVLCGLAEGVLLQRLLLLASSRDIDIKASLPSSRSSARAPSSFETSANLERTHPHDQTTPRDREANLCSPGRDQPRKAPSGEENRRKASHASDSYAWTSSARPCTRRLESAHV